VKKRTAAALEEFHQTHEIDEEALLVHTKPLRHTGPGELVNLKFTRGCIFATQWEVDIVRKTLVSLQE